MFGRLKKSLKDSIKKIARKAEEPDVKKEEKEKKRVEKKPDKKIEKKPEKPRKEEKKQKKKKPEKPEIVKEEPIEEHVEELAEKEPVEEPEPEPIEEPEEEKRGFFGLGRKITTRRLTSRDIDDFFDDNETEFLTNNVAVEVLDFFRKNLKDRLVEKPIKRSQVSKFVAQVFEDTLFEIINQGDVNLEKMSREKKPLLMVFLGFNGSGKTTSIARVAKYMMKKGKKVVLAAGDTFRAASIEQLEVHGKKLGVRVIKHQYGSDSAAVVFDAMRFAESNGYDVVLADTAGRMHTNKNLMDELKKVIRVNNPHLKVLVVDSLTGNDAVEQAERFHDAVGVDSVIMTKTDVNPKGGSILSVCYAIKKPILFIGTGQGYEDIIKFDPKKFVKDMLS
ncbi:signal recognition particle-docking protein FtsY [Candidatus Aenigmatarchaeota archaeon]